MSFHRYLLMVLSVAACAVTAFALPANMRRISGVVVDSLTNEPVEYAQVMLVGTDRGVLTDERGKFEIVTALRADSLLTSAMGYETKRVKMGPRVADMRIELLSTGVRLSEVVARPKKEPYSKKNNPAVELMERIRRQGKDNDPRRNDFYNYEKYERIAFGYNNFDAGTEENPSALVKQFPFLREYVDTSDVTGAPVLFLAEREKAGKYNFRHSPRDEKEVVSGRRSAGIDEIIDKESMQRFYEDVMREIDIYDSDINLLRTRFVGPLSGISADFYKFYITDTVMIDTLRCVELSFVPRNSSTMGFVGRLYVDVADTVPFVRRVRLNVPRDINLNYVDNLVVTQEYGRASDGSRLKLLDDMVMEASVLPGTPSLYSRRRTEYFNHNFDKDGADERVFQFGGRQLVEAGADERTESYWRAARRGPEADGRKSVADMMRELRTNPLYYWGEKVLKVLVGGYISTGSDSKVDIGPMNTTMSYNDIEGLRLRAGGLTTANLSKRWFARGYGAYGFKDHKWKYSGEVEYSFHDKKYHSREFPVHSLRLTHLYDVDMLGQHYAFTNPDNVFLSLKRRADTQMTYHRVTKLEHRLELQNNFSVMAKLQTERQEATRYMTFVDGLGVASGHYTMNSATIELRYAPGEKFLQTKSNRFPINLDAPVMALSHTVAPMGFAGNRYTLNRTEASFAKRFWFSAFGYADVILKGGHVWSKVPYPELLIPNANLSYTIQPESFACLNPMEFITDTYAQWDFTYWANGAILNYIPGLKRLKLREAFAFRGFFGRLSDKNNPGMNPELFRFPADAMTQQISARRPYMEAAVGIDNIFTILRVDYVWRLSYRRNPGACLGGVRIALHFSF